MRQADWYFDVLSPFAYLQLKAQLPRLRALVEIVPKPIVLGPLLAHWGQKGPAEIAPKRLHMFRIVQHRAQVLGLPFRFPPAHPFNPLLPTRALVAAGARWAAVEAVFALIWEEGLDLSDAANLPALAAALDVPDLAARVASDAVKLALRQNVEAAIAAGVFGVPSFVMEGETFWGEDSSDLFAAFVADPDLFRRPEMARLATIPVGVTRR